MTDDENRKPGTPQWWTTWNDYRQGLSQCRSLVDKLAAGEIIYSKRLEAAEGFADCLAMLDEAEASLNKAKDARARLHELTATQHQTGTAT
jgi:hypothetical protein